MKAYKGFNKDITSVLGNRDKETTVFRIGETKRVRSSKTAREGFHCCEYIFDCLSYYAMNGENRFFLVEAAGNIDEDENNRIACTEITLMKELTPVEMARAGMEYIIMHPERDGWKQSRGSVIVEADIAEAQKAGHIAIARGRNPKVKGPAGSFLGMLIDGEIVFESEEREKAITGARLIIVPEIFADKWLTLSEEGEVMEVET